jgi:dUTP pyrophosphatase
MMTMYPTIDVQLDDGAIMPERAHDIDAGADIFAPYDVEVPPSRANKDGTVDIGCAIVRTGVHVELPENSAGMIKSKSSHNFERGIISEGVIDQGYGGEIWVKLYNLTGSEVTFPRGSKITQLCVIPTMYPSFRRVGEIGAGERGNGGFGSTGSISGGARL